MSFTLSWEPRGVQKHFGGCVTANEFILSVEQVQADPRFDDLRYVINDFSDVTELDLSAECFERLVTMNMGAYLSNPNIRVAFVTADARIKTTIETLQDSSMNPYDIVVFPSLSLARAWIGCAPREHQLRKFHARVS